MQRRPPVAPLWGTHRDDRERQRRQPGHLFGHRLRQRSELLGSDGDLVGRIETAGDLQHVQFGAQRFQLGQNMFGASGFGRGRGPR